MNILNTEKNGLVAIMAGFLLGDGNISYKGFETLKSEFQKDFEMTRNNPLDEKLLKKKLSKIYDEILFDERKMDLSIAEILVALVLNSNEVYHAVQENDPSSIGFFIAVNASKNFEVRIRHFDWPNWMLLKQDIIKSCDGSFFEQLLGDNDKKSLYEKTY
jgi:hypothetical protein